MWRPPALTLPNGPTPARIACAAAVAVYAKTVLWMRIPEAHQIQSLVVQRLRGA